MSAPLGWDFWKWRRFSDWLSSTFGHLWLVRYRLVHNWEISRWARGPTCLAALVILRSSEASTSPSLPKVMKITGNWSVSNLPNWIKQEDLDTCKNSVMVQECNRGQATWSLHPLQKQALLTHSPMIHGGTSVCIGTIHRHCPGLVLECYESMLFYRLAPSLIYTTIAILQHRIIQNFQGLRVEQNYCNLSIETSRNKRKLVWAFWRWQKRQDWDKG